MIRDIRFLPLLLASELKPDQRTVVISILDKVTTSQRPDFCGFHDCLELSFSDTYEEANDAQPGAWPDEPTSSEHAKLSAIEGECLPSLSHAAAIVEFVHKHHASGSEVRLVVHCHGGTSRSAAVAKWASERLGIPLQHLTKFGTTDANPRLFRLLEKADAVRPM